MGKYLGTVLIIQLKIFCFWCRLILPMSWPAALIGFLLWLSIHRSGLPNLTPSLQIMRLGGTKLLKYRQLKISSYSCKDYCLSTTWLSQVVSISCTNLACDLDHLMSRLCTDWRGTFRYRFLVSFIQLHFLCGQFLSYINASFCWILESTCSLSISEILMHSTMFHIGLIEHFGLA